MLIDDNDLKDIVEITTDKNVIYISNKNPWGFWSISLKKGTLPANLKGSYTTKDQAVREVVRWVEAREQKVTDIQL